MSTWSPAAVAAVAKKATEAMEDLMREVKVLRSENEGLKRQLWRLERELQDRSER